MPKVQNNPYATFNGSIRTNYAPYGIQRSQNSSQIDYFTHSLNSQNAQTNPILHKINECLVRVAPKIFLSKYINENAIKQAAKTNKKIQELLASKGLAVNVDMKNVTGEIEKHFIETYSKAKELGHDLPLNEYGSMLQAALLHDIGKAFIPREILDKPAALTPEEKEIVDLHAEIGAEVLKAMNLNPRVVEAVKIHHIDSSNPIKQNNKMAQILSVADVYSALKDKRPYKKAFTNEQVRNIMQNDLRLNQDVVSTLFFQQDLSDMSNFKL